MGEWADQNISLYLASIRGKKIGFGGAKRLAIAEEQQWKI